MTMTKQDLVQQLAEKAAVSKVVAERVLDALCATVTETLRAGGEVKLAELGRFTVKHRAARKAVNPRNGEPVDVPAKAVPRFTAGKALKDALQGGHVAR
jgi:DNA-binding protein HU-beta